MMPAPVRFSYETLNPFQAKIVYRTHGL